MCFWIYRKDFNIMFFVFFYLDIKKDMLFATGKTLSTAILLILKHSKFGIT